jgi:hypothetical protein
MRARLTGAAAILLLAVLAAPAPRAGTGPVVEWLETYAAGHYDRVVGAFTGDTDYDEVLRQLRRDAPGWIAAGGPSDIPKRELIAATLALEAARVGLRYDWKRTQMQPKFEDLQVLNVLYWKAPPLLIEWGCAMLRKTPQPRPAERWWQLAALSVALRSEDSQFLVGDPAIGRGVGAGEIGNTADEIKHLDHVQARFPNERRFLLAQGIVRDRVWPEDAVQAYSALENDPDVGGEAVMRLAAMRMRSRNPSGALRLFERALELTRDPYVVYLAHYFSGRIYEQQPNLSLAEASYRSAAAAIPNAQSATLALAALLARDRRRAEAQRLVGEMLAANPPPLDPWRRYVHADDRFWPFLIARLRQEIAR